MIDLNRYFDELPLAYAVTTKDSLLLLFNEAGDILQFWPKISLLDSLIPILKERGNVRHDFEIDAPGEGLQKRVQVFRAKSLDWRKEIYGRGLFSDLPLIKLSSYPVKDGNYFGVITYSDIFPDFL